MSGDLLPRLARRAEFCDALGWAMAITHAEHRELSTLGVLSFTDPVSPGRIYGVEVEVDDDQAARQMRAMEGGGPRGRVTLGRRRVGATHCIPSGVYDLSTEVATTIVGDELAVFVTGFVLAEHAGKPAADIVRALLPRRPRWIPRFLWRRIPTVTAEWTLTAEPLWTYPQSSVALPDLGPATSAIDVRLDRVGVSDWRAEGA